MRGTRKPMLTILAGPLCRFECAHGPFVLGLVQLVADNDDDELRRGERARICQPAG